MLTTYYSKKLLLQILHFFFFLLQQTFHFLVNLIAFFFPNWAEDSWFPRSLFVVHAHLVVCIEDFMQFGSFGSLSEDRSPPYYSLHSCCSIADIYEMVIFFSLFKHQSLSSRQCEGSEFVLQVPGLCTSNTDITCLSPILIRMPIPQFITLGVGKEANLRQENKVGFSGSARDCAIPMFQAKCIHDPCCTKSFSVLVLFLVATLRSLRQMFDLVAY